ncbi:ATPase family gene 2 protein homolog A [Phymastichus coffea]|uniref:ATPase family gene 2 protein homolog A n=1 Tax=Phymastichus coffea TaxID=108790 RepID=UPI00273C8CF9|nr:ATPase family gene 2 protein homolog A [Phymastichus coffea]
MHLKGRRSTCPWVNCDKCQAFLAQKDINDHEQNCPPSEPWKPGFIKDDVLHSILEPYKSTELPKFMSTKELNNFIFMSEFALQQCKIPIGDPVLISNKDAVVVKKAWPMGDKTTNFNSVFLTKNAMELNNLEGSVTLEKLQSEPHLAHEVIIESVGKNRVEHLTTDLTVLIKNYNHNNIFSIGNRICIPYYGRKLIFKIIDIKAEEKLINQFSMMNLSNECKVLYKVLYSTKWTIFQSTEPKNETKKLERHSRICSFGGYSNLIENLKDLLLVGLGKCGTLENFHISRGILLYGPSGVGKSMISEVLLSQVEANIIRISSHSITSKNHQVIETDLSNLFKEAVDKAPSIILIDNIDKLCPKRSNSKTEHEDKVLESLITLIDNLQDSKNVMILALTSKPNTVDSSLRRPGRIDKEFEMSVPTRQVRREIIEKILAKVPCTLNDEDIEQISYETHGFIAADLLGLCSTAEMDAIRNNLHSDVPYDSNKIMVTRKNFNNALNIVNPSAMKEILIDVPNVKWSDIGGQRDLKLKLKQSVEWSLKRPEAFKKFNTTPPKGVLMFGPPGCSKTMIAKALATESKLNFLNIKGPELFSKWVGESEKSVRELFKKAQQVAPSIIFIDEIDGLAVERGTSSGISGSSVQERIVTQLLTELDGVTALRNVTLIAATNRPDRIDPALLRPGRFDRLIYVPLPDAETRLEIFQINLRGVPIDKDVNLKDLVELTEGYSGAEIKAICNEAGMKAVEEDVEQITKEHFRIALSVVIPRTHPDTLKAYENFIRPQ